jgi:hypothetical protein
MPMPRSNPGPRKQLLSMHPWRPRLRGVVCLAAVGLLFFFVAGIHLGSAAAQGGDPPTDPRSRANPHGDLKDDCSLCHSSDAWIPARIDPKFDHAKRGFALQEAHAGVTCRACHLSLDFAKAESRCASCHEDVHRGEFGPDCRTCHTTRAFTDPSEMVRAHLLSRFPLTGAHAVLACEACHAAAGEGKPRFASLPTDCSSCHLDEYRAAVKPDHVAAGIPQDCTQCHETTTWQGATMNHDLTGFPLTGAHRQVDCGSCHTSGSSSPKDPRCETCHQAAFAAAVSPNHYLGGFSQDCGACHTTTRWDETTFDMIGLPFRWPEPIERRTATRATPGDLQGTRAPLV